MKNTNRFRWGGVGVAGAASGAHQQWGPDESSAGIKKTHEQPLQLLTWA